MTIVQRIKGICLKPKEEWEVIAGESSTTADLLKNYVAPLAAIGAVAGFIGMSFIGVSAFGISVRMPLVTGLVGAAIGFVAALVEVYVLALIIDALAPKFGGEKNISQALKISAYSFTPALVAGVLRIIPALGVLALLASFYGVYLIYLGLPRLMKAPPEKAVNYTLVVVACAIGIFVVIGAVTGAIVGAGTVATGGLLPQ
jgi:hypothetical protein